MWRDRLLPTSRRSTMIVCVFMVRQRCGQYRHNPWQLRELQWMIAGNAELLTQQHLLIGITVLAIVAYDDASTDRTVKLLRNHPKI